MVNLKTKFIGLELKSPIIAGSCGLTSEVSKIEEIALSGAGAIVLKSIFEEQINMDYILDERMRELGIEEKRRLTLMRTGLLYDRVMKCNPYYANPETNGDGVGMQKHYNLWPIPQSAIEANIGAKLEQNPGY